MSTGLRQLNLADYGTKKLVEAKKFVSAAISNSLRTDNKYRKFVLFQEVCVAQAKQPEVEFVCWCSS